MAIKLYQKRKPRCWLGKKLPESLRARKVGFLELANDALEYSRIHNNSYDDDQSRMAKPKDWLGERPVESWE